ncbi:HK97 family phage major capsid protein [Paenochrobactrum gallinarii]|uniref:HK97 family phage major capsid protein n=1 Tax=Paenochrobactrum gallinarii TaxID=643673 RepID=A0A841LVP0_9HYPH|nr:phage major capsid protein [Paenochrobactrum gallinarii]MBB6262425.1 HK97 family phage major capsid protein [Paenochrobactrum gallinarii]
MTQHVSQRKTRGIVAVRADGSSDVTKLFADLNKDWEAFKTTMSQKDAEIAARFDDVVTTDKLKRIEEGIGETNARYEAEIDKLNAKFAAMSVNGGSDGSQLSEADRAYKATFEEWFRTGDGESNVKAAIRAGEITAAYEVGDDSKGGYTAPIEWDRTITDERVEISPMRRFASVQSVTGQGFTKLYNLHGTTSAWVGETANRPQTDGSVLATYAFSFGEIYAMPAATERILEDSEIDMAAWLASEVNIEFAYQEGAAFINGDGVNKPKGILRYDATTETALPAAQRHPLGPISEVLTGDANGLTADGLIDLIYDLPEDRSQGAALYANRKTHAIIRKMKDGQDNYLWQPPFQSGQPAQVLGQPIHELAGMPDVAAGTIPVLFGNMAQAYRIFDRVGMSVLRDPYTNKPYVLFYTRKRVGGGMWNPEWIRYYRVGDGT